MSLIQILPVNDTSAALTWRDSYPYSGISVFALHPLYLDLTPLMDVWTPSEKKRLKAQQTTLNALPDVDYEQTMALKWEYLRIAYGRDGGKTLKSKAFKDFYEPRRDWLVPYAAFCCLRGKFGTADFTQWGEYAEFSKEKITAVAGGQHPDFEEMGLHYYMQFLLHAQLKDAADYCRSLGVRLKGDIPIGISRHSCDAWTAPRLYNMDAQAGAPPDPFSATGQNWGFPTYNWERMAQDGYLWWRRRLQAMAEYFDAFRIDHILGFFRIWEIPLHSVQGLLGRFVPALPLSVGELGRRGAWFDADRLCKPYIRTHILKNLFGKDADKMTALFFEEYRSQCYGFKPKFNTQQKIEAYFDTLEKPDPALKDALFSLINDVTLVEDSRQAGHYHPRIAMHYTRSYQELDEPQKQALDAIYIDFFYHRHNDFWKQQALQKLPAICGATQMIACGEDLGMVPQCVPEVMRSLNLLGLVIQRMPADSGTEFALLQNAPCLSVCATGTHDMATLRQWWTDDRPAVQRFYNGVLGRGGEAPQQCEDWIAREILLQHLHSPSALAIFPIQDLLAIHSRLRRPDPAAERINVPANPHHYWRYRMHLNIEDLLAEQDFTLDLRQMIENSGR